MILMTLLLIIIYPLIKTGIEINALKSLKHDVQIASETAVNDLVAGLSTKSLSEGVLIWHSDIKTLYHQILQEKLSHLAIEVVPESLIVLLSGTQKRPSIEVQYFFEYVGIVTLLEKRMEVSFVYEMPIDN